MIKVGYNKIRYARVLLFRSKIMICIVALCVAASFFTGCKVNRTKSGRKLFSHDKIRGEVELTARVQTNKQTGGNESRKSTTMDFHERLNLKTRGNVYHPNLLSYSAAIGVGLIQHDYDSDEEDDKMSGTVHDYNFSANILRAKPYPISLYTSKSERLVPRRFLSGLKVEDEASGIGLGLHLKKWPMNFQYSTLSKTEDSLGSTSSNASGDFSKRVEDRFRYALSHSFGPDSDFNFDFERIEETNKNSYGKRENDRDTYRARHQLGFGKTKQNNLNSFLDYYETTGISSTENFKWNEMLRLNHSKRFSTNYAFRFIESKNVLNKNTETNWDAGFNHKLYKSLTTTGTIKLSESKIGNISETQQRQTNLALNYNKTNPFGIFSTSYSTNLSKSQQSGGSGIGDVLDELHRATPSPVILNHRNIDITTIRVDDKDGYGDIYHIGSDYTVTEVNGRVQLTVLPFGSVAPDPYFKDTDISAVNGKVFYVDYEYLIEPKRQEETVSQRFNIRQDFKFGLSLFYGHFRTDQSITSNVTDITPDESRSNIYGFDYGKGRFGLFGEYITLDSTQIVSTTKRLRARYNMNINTSTFANIHALKEIYTYTFPDAMEIDIFRIGSELTSQFTRRLSATAGVNYYERKSSAGDKTTGLQFRTDFKYRYRQIFLSTGLSYNSLEGTNSKNDSLSINFRVKRYF
jgi:hypothetical protein